LPKNPPLALALEAAQEIVAACAGFNVAVSFLDASGTPKLYYVADGADGQHAYTAFRKAYTALLFKMPTAEVGALTRTDQSAREKVLNDPNLLTFAGGLLVKRGEDIIGAVGVSGAEPSSKDEECGLAGLRRIQNRLQGP
jgi:uncharacterized protein GlcG (DUF336 family)